MMASNLNTFSRLVLFTEFYRTYQRTPKGRRPAFGMFNFWQQWSETEHESRVPIGLEVTMFRSVQPTIDYTAQMTDLVHTFYRYIFSVLILQDYWTTENYNDI